MQINRTEIAVRYQETDQMGVVYHANYLVWFEIGRTSFIEQLGFTYAEMEEAGVLLPVIDAQLTYHKPARYGEKVYIETRLEKYAGIRLRYNYTVKSKNDEVLVTGHTEHTFTTKDPFKPIQLRKVNNKWHELLLGVRKE